ncbi:MAG: SsrA-binding protein SmpB [Elusimicrobia bacterium]|nr:SsrA-binding protein SmpB [Elusimicrobiota bacterium]
MGKSDKKEAEAKQTVATNRKARHFYEVLEVFEAGLCLTGPEVKSLRDGRASLDGCFGRHEGRELFLFNFYIPPYRFNTASLPLDSRRTRKLLMSRAQIDRIARSLQTKGLTMVPLEVYFRRGWAKVALALARGKKSPDRRDDLKKKAVMREAQKSFKGKYRG